MLDLIIRLILYPIKVLTFILIHILLLLPKQLFDILSPYCILIIMWCIGFNKPTIIDKRTFKTPIDKIPIVVYQHSTFADHYILLSIFTILRYVVLDKHRGNPVVKRFTDMFGCITVSETVKSGATKKIQEFIDKGDYKYKLAIAPEGGRRLDDDGNSILAPFSTGAFVPLAPIQPITIKFNYDTEKEDPTWNSINLTNNDNVASWYFSRFFAKPCNITVTLMEEAIPTEGMTPKDYSDDVRNKMIYEITGNPRIFETYKKKNEKYINEDNEDKEENNEDSEENKEEDNKVKEKNDIDGGESELKEILIDKIATTENGSITNNQHDSER
jgi:hypothetical protein